MRKILFLLIFMANFFVQAQYKYKVEYDIIITGITSSNRELSSYTIDLYNSSNLNLENIFSRSAISGLPPQSFRITVDKVLNFNSPIDYILHKSEGSGCPFDAIQAYYNSSLCSYNLISNCVNLQGDFTLERIRNLDEINNPNIAIELCKAKTINIFENVGCEYKYSVQAIINGQQTITILPYQLHTSNSFEFNPSTISGLKANDIIQFRINYVEIPIENKDWSSISFDVIACSPNLLNTTKTDATCNGATDGSVTLTFDKNVDIAGGYEMRYFVYQGDPTIFPLARLKDENQPVVTGIQTVADPFITLNPNFEGIYSGLGEGSYFIVYQEVNYGTIPVTVKSGEITPQFIIGSPTPVITNGTFTPSTCGNDASIALSASGGNAPNGYTYQYNINGSAWQAATNPLNITPTSNQQTINVRAVVANNTDCFGNVTNFVVAPSTPQLAIVGSPTFVSPTTDTSTDGSIRIEIENGTPNFIYELNKVNGNQTIASNISSRTFDFATIDVGTYNITVTDSNNCSQTSSNIVVTKELIPDLTANPVAEITCFNSTNGSVSAQVSGFTSNYKYQWIINSVASGIQIGSSASLTLSNLNSGGTYVLRVASGRLSDVDFVNTANYNEVTFTLASPSQVTITNATPNNTSCNGGSDGSITLNLSGGTTYEYALGNSPTNWATLTANTITNLSPGLYTVTVRNQNGCESQTVTAIFIDEPTAISVTEIVVAHKNATSNLGSEGALSITVAGGTTTYKSYNWTLNGNTFTPSLNSTSTELVNLKAGTYHVLITDTNDCIGEIISPIVITEPGPLGITSLNPTPVACKGVATGSITAIVTGAPDFTYIWSKQGNATFNAPNAATIADLSFGTYTLSLTDASGDPAVTSSVTITEPTVALTATATTIPTACFNGNDGQIIIAASGGTAPYQYSINGDIIGAQNSNSFSSLSGDTYTITVIDANACEYTINDIAVNQATPITITTDLINNISEAGQSDGAIYTSTAGGSLLYTYSWSGPNGFNAATKDITNLAEGFYTLTVTDSNTCTTSETFNITEPGELLVSITQLVFLECNGDNFAEIEALVQGGVLNYTYQWFQMSDGKNTELSETSNLLASLAAGTYFVVVTDANNVARTSTNIVVTEPNLLTATLSSKTDVLCRGDETGSIELSIAGGTAPYAFYWNDVLSTQNLNNLPSGEYFFEVVDANGCFEQLEVTIDTPLNPLTITSEIVTDAFAYQATDGSITLEITGGAPEYTLEWTRLSDNSIISNQNSIINLSADTYQIIIIDTNGCSLTEIYQVNQPDIIEETITALTCAGGDDSSISLIVNKGNGAFTYSWNTGETSSTITNLAAGEYTVVITGFDQPLTRTYTVEDPLPIQVDLGEDRVLCVDQVLELNTTVENPNASYLWTADNGFSSIEPIVVLTKQGNYTLTISTDTGCIATGAIAIEVSDEEISAEFAASSQVYVGELLILVDISYPLPDSMEWIIPENAQILKNDADEAEIVFDTSGEYEIGIITQRESCTEIQTKKVLVLANDHTVTKEDTENGKKLVEDFLIYPNPTSGVFNAQVTLTEKGNISIKIFSLSNNMLIATEKARGESTYNIPFNIYNMPAGVYAVLLETPFGSTLRKIIVK